MLAKAQGLANDTTNSLKQLNDCISKDFSMVEAHILAAMINSQQGNSKASQLNL
jgi:Tfp pilus assembly protein PilF